MDKKYAITILKWVLYKFYAGINDALAVHQLIEANYSLRSQADDVKAISDYLHFTSFVLPEVIRTRPDEVCEDHINRNPRKGIVLKTSYPTYVIYVELKHLRYNRSRSQLDLEARVLKQGYTYLVVDGFTDFLHQLTYSLISGAQRIEDTS